MTPRIPSLLPRLILSAAACFPAALQAQSLYNGGAILMVKPGATLTVSGDYQHAPGAVLYTEGTMQVTGSVTGSSGSDIDLNIGALEVGGDFTQNGHLYSTRTGRLVLNGRSNQNLSLPNTLTDTLGSLVIDKPVPGADTVRVLTGFSLKGNFDLRSGMVRTAPNRSILMMTNTATLTGETTGRFVQGMLMSYRRNVGGNQPIDLQNGVTLNPGGQNMGVCFVVRTAGLRRRSVSYIDNPANPAQRSIDQVWTILNTNAVSTPVPVTMRWLPDNDNGIPPADFARATAWSSALVQSPVWVPTAPYQDASSRSLTILTTDFTRQWTIATAVAPLPIELISFDATRSGAAARLSWTTASEQNSAYFEVEVSVNGRDFQPVPVIGRIAAHGTTTAPHAYSTSDPALLTYAADPVYYRLRQVDTDGTATYSAVRALHIGPALPGKLTATLWPNPSTTTTIAAQLHVTLPTAAPLTITLFDAVGRLLQTQTVTPAAPGAQTLVVPGAEAGTPLAAGVYTVQVRQGAETVVQRLLRE